MSQLYKSENYRVFENLFKSGSVVVKIQSIENGVVKDKSLPIDYDEYRKRLETHKYTPLLYIVEFPILFCYLFDLLNRSPNTSRTETFTCVWRVIGKDEWKELFQIDPYVDNSL